MEKYPVGRVIRVYYHPDNPRESVLEPGETTGQVWFLLFGSTLFLLVGILGLYLRLR